MSSWVHDPSMTDSAMYAMLHLEVHRTLAQSGWCRGPIRTCGFGCCEWVLGRVRFSTFHAQHGPALVLLLKSSESSCALK